MTTNLMGLRPSSQNYKEVVPNEYPLYCVHHLVIGLIPSLRVSLAYLIRLTIGLGHPYMTNTQHYLSFLVNSSRGL